MNARLDDSTLLRLRHISKQQANQTHVHSKARSVQRQLELVICELERRLEERADTKPQRARCPHTVDLVTYIEEAGE